jgi:hypothetical protein
MNLSPIYKIYNVLLFALAIEEIVTILLSNYNKPLANIYLQLYPSFVLIGNLGVILKILHCKIKIIENKISSISNFFQLLYQAIIFIFLLCVIFSLLDDKTFDKNIKLLLMPEKYKLLYVNGILGGLVNLLAIIYLTCLMLPQKYNVIDEPFLKEYGEG